MLVNYKNLYIKKLQEPSPVSGKLSMPMFVYWITDATQEEMDLYNAYLESEGYTVQYCDKTGLPIFQTPNSLGTGQALVDINPETGKPRGNNEALIHAESMANSLGQSVGQHLATNVYNATIGARVDNLAIAKTAKVPTPSGATPRKPGVQASRPAKTTNKTAGDKGLGQFGA
jgi:hypothetical protein